MTTYVIWDWNGTLIDDVRFGLELMNDVLAKRGMSRLRGLKDYYRAFAFPIRRYYANVGFVNEEAFLSAANEWMDAYMAGEDACPLRDTAVAAIDHLSSQGINQVVISASEIGNLTKQVARLGLSGRFDALCGLEDIYASGKAEIARRWLASSGADANHVTLIGDTAHDFDVAKAIGCRCVLVSGGHQSREALKLCGCPVANSPYEAVLKALEEEEHASDAGSV